MEMTKRCPICRSDIQNGKCTQTRRATCPYMEKIEKQEDNSK